MSKALFLALSLIASPAWADWQLNMNEGVTALSREIFDLHMLIFWICVAIGVVVFGVMFYSIFKHRNSSYSSAEVPCLEHQFASESSSSPSPRRLASQRQRP